MVFFTTYRYINSAFAPIAIGDSATNQKTYVMSFWRVLLAIIFPPLSVLGKGCGSFLIVLLLTFCGWVPGVIAALIILNNTN